jgi:hypothetical protein
VVQAKQAEALALPQAQAERQAKQAEASRDDRSNNKKQMRIL